MQETTCESGDVCSILGSGRFPGEGNGNLLQYYRLGNPMNREMGRLQSMESQKSWTQLSDQVHNRKKKTHHLPSRSNMLLLFIFKIFTNNFQENKRIVKNNFIQNFHKEYKHRKQFLLYIFPLSRYIRERNLNLATFSEFN